MLWRSLLLLLSSFFGSLCTDWSTLHFFVREALSMWRKFSVGKAFFPGRPAPIAESYMVGREDRWTNNRTMFPAVKNNAAAGYQGRVTIELFKGLGLPFQTCNLIGWSKIVRDGAIRQLNGKGKFCANGTVMSFWNRKTSKGRPFLFCFFCGKFPFYPRVHLHFSRLNWKFWPMESVPDIVWIWICSLSLVSFIFHHSCAGTHAWREPNIRFLYLTVDISCQHKIVETHFGQCLKTQNRSFYHCKLLWPIVIRVNKHTVIKH